MDPKATVQTLMDAVQKGDFVKAQATLADDFQYSRPVPEPISGPAWMGMGVIPATNKSFAAAHEHLQSTVQDGKVKTWSMDPTEGAGLMAILGQLGVKPQTT